MWKINEVINAASYNNNKKDSTELVEYPNAYGWLRYFKSWKTLPK